MKFLHYILQIFDEQETASFARWATAVTVLTGVWAIAYLVLKNHALPESAQLLALGAWMVSPYSVGKVAGVFTRRDEPGHVDSLSASEGPHQRRLPSDERVIYAIIVFVLLLVLVARR